MSWFYPPNPCDSQTPSDHHPQPPQPPQAPQPPPPPRRCGPGGWPCQVLRGTQPGEGEAEVEVEGAHLPGEGEGEGKGEDEGEGEGGGEDEDGDLEPAVLLDVEHAVLLVADPLHRVLAAEPLHQGHRRPGATTSYIWLFSSFD